MPADAPSPDPGNELAGGPAGAGEGSKPGRGSDGGGKGSEPDHSPASGGEGSKPGRGSDRGGKGSEPDHSPASGGGDTGGEGSEPGSGPGGGDGEPGYAEARAELDQILAELGDDDLDVDVLAERVARASTLIEICRGRITNARIQVERVIAAAAGPADQT